MANKKTKPKIKPKAVKSTSTASSTKTKTVTRVVTNKKTYPTVWAEAFSGASLSNALVELIGTFVITALFLSLTMSAIGFGLFGGNGQLGLVVLAIGMATVYTVLRGYFNPVFSALAAFFKQITPTRAVVHIVAQVLGAMLAFIVISPLIAGINKPEITQDMVDQYGGDRATVEQMMDGQYPSTLKLKLPETSEEKDGKTETKLDENKTRTLMVLEFAGAAVLAFMVAGYMADSRRNEAIRGVVFGLASVVAISVVTQLTSLVTFDQVVAGGKAAFAVINPAMMTALSPDWNKWMWILGTYAVAPLAGAIVGGFVYKLTTRLAAKN